MTARDPLLGDVPLEDSSEAKEQSFVSIHKKLRVANYLNITTHPLGKSKWLPKVSCYRAFAYSGRHKEEAEKCLSNTVYCISEKNSTWGGSMTGRRSRLRSKPAQQGEPIELNDDLTNEFKASLSYYEEGLGLFAGSYLYFLAETSPFMQSLNKSIDQYELRVFVFCRSVFLEGNLPMPVSRLIGGFLTLPDLGRLACVKTASREAFKQGLVEKDLRSNPAAVGMFAPLPEPESPPDRKIIPPSSSGCNCVVS